MSQHRDDHHPVRRIVLRSGRAIEVIPLAKEDEARTGSGLHVCPECDSELVQPVEWGRTASERWELTLHCPNCDWSRRDTYDYDQVAELEERLDHGVTAILRDLKRLMGANMADEVERFAAALEADLILPEDF